MLREWEGEPNSKDWTAHGLPCAMRRGPGGHWCGYVGLSPGHPNYRKDYSDALVDVHGGLTYGNDGDGKRLPEGYYWLGFDCAHHGDKCPEYERLSALFPDGIYRNEAYVTEQTERLAEQLAAIGVG